MGDFAIGGQNDTNIDHSGKAHSGGSLWFTSWGRTGKLKCFTCHSEGHLKREYTMKKSSGFVKKGKRDQDFDSSDDEGNAYFGEALVVVENDKMIELVMASGGSYHMIHMADFLYDFKGFDGGSAQLGDNRICTIKGIGKVKLKLHNGSSYILENVRYVPGLKRSLISLVGFKQLGPGVETGVHRVQDEKCIWFEVELQGAQKDREAEGFQVSNDDAAVGQRRLEDTQLEEKTNMDCLEMVQEKKKVKESMKANIGKLLNYKAYSLGSPRFEVPAQGKDAEYWLCLSVTPKVCCRNYPTSGIRARLVMVTKDRVLDQGAEIKDEDQTLMLLTLLPPYYEYFVKTLFYGRESLTMDDALAKLNSRELKKRTEGTQEETSDGVSIKERFDHSEGHLKRDCLMKNSSGFVKKAKRDQDSDSSNNKGNAYFGEALVVVKNDEMTKLVMDSCRSYHMTHMRDFLYDFKSFDGGSIQLGDNRTCTIKGTGEESIEYRMKSVFGLRWNCRELKRIIKLRFSGGSKHYGNRSIQEGAEGNVAEKEKVEESMEANIVKLLNYNACSTRWSSVRGFDTRKRC
uniref:Retrovirus-related Pol polyprotein from transposon TNT 1-94 n=1 Tax=Tanacetum cinerariifolium TaxID=118510 RepID=A0A699H1B7_TANCI|nr:retrovirus-related Pol polyprotein from transposon TNT 1-94 [Tanacetum cinerariifolium]